MFITFPVLGDSGLATINTRIFLSRDDMIPNCKDCAQTMNELYIVSGCSLQTDEEKSIHIHFSHRHYEQNMSYRTHYCIATKKSYDFPKSH